MRWPTRFSGLFSAALVMVVVLSPSLQSFPPAEAIRSSQLDGLPLPLPLPIGGGGGRHAFRRAPEFRNAAECGGGSGGDGGGVCDESLVHIAITLDEEYLRGSVAAVHSVLRYARCPEDVFFHFLVASDPARLEALVRSAFPRLRCKLYFFDPERVRSLISSSVRQALEQPLNYARNYLPDLLEPCVRRVVYLDSDLVLVDDVAKLWRTDLAGRAVGAPEYCRANFTKYFTPRFWSDPSLASTFSSSPHPHRRGPSCYFNTGVMVLDLDRWRRRGYTRRIERWMEVAERSAHSTSWVAAALPAGVRGARGPIDHRWNQHGLGGDNVLGSCRDLHAGPVSLLHWSGSGKPWARIDALRPCPLDSLWSPFDLYLHSAPSPSPLLLLLLTAYSR
ncbi:putative galacturonosyltransferase-like 7 [Ananas comosus]|uniref:Hexosyltransferase n=1 Tax=Ananas comosus TaxID=4615 RepID=A0A199VJU2_ANACO|nr:putative galacturonosyltransferase-like 7 [Ananas comosus]